MGLSWFLVSPEEVGAVWHEVSPILARAVERDEGRRSLHDILRSLVNGQAALWVITDGKPIGAIVTALNIYPRKRTIKVEWLAGERYGEWAHLMSEVEKHAKSYECTAVEFAGRPGFARIMKQHGYEIVAVEARKAI